MYLRRMRRGGGEGKEVRKRRWWEKEEQREEGRKEGEEEDTVTSAEAGTDSLARCGALQRKWATGFSCHLPAPNPSGPGSRY